MDYHVIHAFEFGETGILRMEIMRYPSFVGMV